VPELREATASETADWQADWEARLESWYAYPDAPADWLASLVSQRVQRQLGSERGSVLTVLNDDLPIGTVAAVWFEEGGSRAAMLSDLWIAPAYRRQGHGSAAVRLAEDWARGRGASRLWLLTDPRDPAHAALFARYPVRAQQMIKELSAGDLGAGLSARPMSDAEFDGWRARSVAEYATEMAESGSVSEEAAARASAAEFSQLLPDGLRTKDHTFICLEAGGEVVATNWIMHRRWPEVSWVYGVEVSEGHRGKGYGRAAMVAGEQSTMAAGDAHLALNVFGQNAVAIGMYESMGYRCYDHGRSADL
jgi:GNAT superfamily N-acetyltransferase